MRAWIPTTTDHPIPLAGLMDGVPFVRGRAIGPRIWRVDFLTTLQSGETRVLDQTKILPWSHTPLPLPEDLEGFFGGVPMLNGVPMLVVRLALDAAGYGAHLRARVGRLPIIDIFLRWSPETPGVLTGSASLDMANPSIPDLTETLPAIHLTFGDAVVNVLGPGNGVGRTLFPDGLTLGDNQKLTSHFAMVWPRHLKTELDYSTANAVAGYMVHACGVKNLKIEGSPWPYPGQQNFAKANINGSLARLRNLDESPLNIPKNSRNSGGIADQAWVRGEGLIDPEAVLVTLLEVSSWGQWTCWARETNGDRLRLDRTGLRLYDGRVHTNGTDLLGKTRLPLLIETGGCFGPDFEHLWAGGLHAAKALTGDPMLELMWQQLAIYYLYSRFPAGYGAHSAIFSARDVMIEAKMVVELWDLLEDRELAELVKQRYIQRWHGVIRPWIGTKEIWDPRPGGSSAALPFVSGMNWIPWQQGPAAYWLDQAGRVFGISGVDEVILPGALRVLDCWRLESGRWVVHDRQHVSGTPSNSSGLYTVAWLPPVIELLRRKFPASEKAEQIWQQMLADSANGSRSWIPPIS